jgi:hypothetical protein
MTTDCRDGGPVHAGAVSALRAWLLLKVERYLLFGEDACDPVEDRQALALPCLF